MRLEALSARLDRMESLLGAIAGHLSVDQAGASADMSTTPTPMAPAGTDHTPGP